MDRARYPDSCKVSQRVPESAGPGDEALPGPPERNNRPGWLPAHERKD